MRYSVVLRRRVGDLASDCVSFGFESSGAVKIDLGLLIWRGPEEEGTGL